MSTPLTQEERNEQLTRAIAEEAEFLNFLKERIGQTISLSMHTETRFEMHQHEPNKADENFYLKLLGVYGFRDHHGFTMARPIYVHAIDLKDDTEKLFRSNSEVMVDEDSGNMNFQSRTEIAIIDGRRVERWFAGYYHSEDKSLVIERMTSAGVTTDEPKILENMAESLLKGRPDYQFGRWQPSYSIFTRDANHDIVDQILQYFDHIV